MHTAVLHDGTSIDFTTYGYGPALLLSAAHRVPTTTEAREAWSNNVDPQPGVTIAQLLRRQAHTVLFDYEAHIFQHPKHRSLTLDNVAQDILSIADAANVPSFAFYGSSWLAMLGPHLARISDRLTGYAMGGFPPISAPLEALLDVARRNHAAVLTCRSRNTTPPEPLTAAEPHRVPVLDFTAPRRQPGGQVSEQTAGQMDGQATRLASEASQARQFVSFFADACRQTYLTDVPTEPLDSGTSRMSGTTDTSGQGLPRVCFVGEQDDLRDRQGRVLLSLAAPVIEHRRALQKRGWIVEVLDTDALGAAQPDVATGVLTPWLTTIRKNHQARQATRQAEESTAQDDKSMYAAFTDGLRGAAQTFTDPIDAYLRSCGVPVNLLSDARLKEAAQALLRFQIDQATDVPHVNDKIPLVVLPFRTAPGPSSTSNDHAAEPIASQGTRGGSGLTREMLEVQIIRRLNELRSFRHSETHHHPHDRPDATVDIDATDDEEGETADTVRA